MLEEDALEDAADDVLLGLVETGDGLELEAEVVAGTALVAIEEKQIRTDAEHNGQPAQDVEGGLRGAGLVAAQLRDVTVEGNSAPDAEGGNHALINLGNGQLESERLVSRDNWPDNWPGEGNAVRVADQTINWWTIDAGGGTSTGGTFSLSGTIGQFDASASMAGGSFKLVGGFWGGFVSPSCGPADMGRQGGFAGPDGLLDNNDFIVFIDFFFTACP